MYYKLKTLTAILIISNFSCQNTSSTKKMKSSFLKRAGSHFEGKVFKPSHKNYTTINNRLMCKGKNNYDRQKFQNIYGQNTSHVSLYRTLSSKNRNNRDHYNYSKKFKLVTLPLLSMLLVGFPESEEAKINLNKAISVLKDSEDILIESDNLQEYYGEALEIYTLMGKCYFNLKDFENAISSFKKALKIAESKTLIEQVFLNKILGDLYILCNNFDKGSIHYFTFAKLSRDNQDILNKKEFDILRRVGLNNIKFLKFLEYEDLVYNFFEKDEHFYFAVFSDTKTFLKFAKLKNDNYNLDDSFSLDNIKNGNPREFKPVQKDKLVDKKKQKK